MRTKERRYILILLFALFFSCRFSDKTHVIVSNNTHREVNLEILSAAEQVLYSNSRVQRDSMFPDLSFTLPKGQKLILVVDGKVMKQNVKTTKNNMLITLYEDENGRTWLYTEQQNGSFIFN